MIDWNPLEKIHHIDDVITKSKSRIVLIFKHSTTCPVSALAKSRLESDWDFAVDDIVPYYLDLLSYRNVSNEIANRFGVQHESPQVILIENGMVIYDNSHLDISVSDIKSVVYA